MPTSISTLATGHNSMATKAPGKDPDISVRITGPCDSAEMVLRRVKAFLQASDESA